MTSNQRGFLLVTVLWLLLGGVLIISYLSTWVANALSNRIQASEQTQFEVDAHSTRSTLLYLLATQRMTIAGLSTNFKPADKSQFDDDGNWSISALGNELRLDNRTYKGVGEVLFSLQDQRGLININYGSDTIISRFL